MFITRQRLHVFCDNKNTAATARGLWLIIQINHHLSLFKPEPETEQAPAPSDQTNIAIGWLTMGKDTEKRISELLLAKTRLRTFIYAWTLFDTICKDSCCAAEVEHITSFFCWYFLQYLALLISNMKIQFFYRNSSDILNNYPWLTMGNRAQMY